MRGLIRQQCGVQGGFFEEGFDESNFEGVGNIARLYGHGYYFGYEGTDRVSVSFKHRRWEGIKAASGCFGFTNGVLIGLEQLVLQAGLVKCYLEVEMRRKYCQFLM